MRRFNRAGVDLNHFAAVSGKESAGGECFDEVRPASGDIRARPRHENDAIRQQREAIEKGLVVGRFDFRRIKPDREVEEWVVPVCPESVQPS